MSQTFDVPCLNFKEKLGRQRENAASAVEVMEEYAMAYITDLENRVSELETENLNLRDTNADLHRRLK